MLVFIAAWFTLAGLGMVIYACARGSHGHYLDGARLAAASIVAYLAAVALDLMAGAFYIIWAPAFGVCGACLLAHRWMESRRRALRPRPPAYMRRATQPRSPFEP